MDFVHATTKLALSLERHGVFIDTGTPAESRHGLPHARMVANFMSFLFVLSSDGFLRCTSLKNLKINEFSSVKVRLDQFELNFY